MCVCWLKLRLIYKQCKGCNAYFSEIKVFPFAWSLNFIFWKCYKLCWIELPDSRSSWQVINTWIYFTPFYKLSGNLLWPWTRIHLNLCSYILKPPVLNSNPHVRHSAKYCYRSDFTEWPCLLGDPSILVHYFLIKPCWDQSPCWLEAHDVCWEQ